MRRRSPAARRVRRPPRQPRCDKLPPAGERASRIFRARPRTRPVATIRSASSNHPAGRACPTEPTAECEPRRRLRRRAPTLAAGTDLATTTGPPSRWELRRRRYERRPSRHAADRLLTPNSVQGARRGGSRQNASGNPAARSRPRCTHQRMTRVIAREPEPRERAIPKRFSLRPSNAQNEPRAAAP